MYNITNSPVQHKLHLKYKKFLLNSISKYFWFLFHLACSSLLAAAPSGKKIDPYHVLITFGKATNQLPWNWVQSLRCKAWQKSCFTTISLVKKFHSLELLLVVHYLQHCCMCSRLAVTIICCYAISFILHNYTHNHTRTEYDKRG